LKTTQVIQIEKRELVESLNQKILNIAEEISYIYSKDSTTLNIYDKESFNQAFDSLKKRERAFFIGKASMLMEIIEELNVYIDKRAFQFISHLSEE